MQILPLAYCYQGVAAVSIHGGKLQEERVDAIRQFKAGTKDVLVATDVAAKGLDFPDIKHVINFDMPQEIENYVHRIGRTGRCGNTGIATTFINNDVEESTLLDLKYVLMKAKQHVPPALLTIEDPRGQHGELCLAACENIRVDFCVCRWHRRRLWILWRLRAHNFELPTS